MKWYIKIVNQWIAYIINNLIIIMIKFINHQDSRHLSQVHSLHFLKFFWFLTLYTFCEYTSDFNYKLYLYGNIWLFLEHTIHTSWLDTSIWLIINIFKQKINLKSTHHAKFSQGQKILTIHTHTHTHTHTPPPPTHTYRKIFTRRTPCTDFCQKNKHVSEFGNCCEKNTWILDYTL